ncbi:MAG: hypothetical protein J7M25_07650, partial [Deltaproteobacteria bacterium]|nr:hypothetical protein [Deltaproteobacteria bacterium]
MKAFVLATFVITAVGPGCVFDPSASTAKLDRDGWLPDAADASVLHDANLDAKEDAHSDARLDSDVDAAKDGSVDADIDGAVDADIDGGPGNVVWVSTTGSDTAGDGSLANPYQTITKGIEQATALGRPNVDVVTGTYPETVTLASDVMVRGGFDSSGQHHDDSSTTIIASNSGRGLIAESVSSAAVEWLSVHVSGTVHRSVYGLFSTGSSVVLTHVTLTLGDADPGPDGPSALNGNPGQPGGDGNDGCYQNSCSRPAPGPGGSSPCGMNGGSGGVPGTPDNGSEAGGGGQSGTGGQPPDGAGGTGGSGGAGTRDGGDPGSPGHPGVSGSPGVPGPGGLNFGQCPASGYVPANGGNGENGGDGGGGGGGGGGDADNPLGTSGDLFGGSGGGGGGGGASE